MTIPVQLDIEGPAFEVPLEPEWPFGEIPRNHFKTIVADPPWRFKTWSAKGDGKAPKYNLMDLEDIKRLPVRDLATKDAVLLMWVIDPMLPHAFDVIKAWGFTYSTVGFTWAKTTKRTGLMCWAPTWHFGLGHWTRKNPEQCWLATVGKPKRVDKGVPQLIVSPIREHSRKPDETLERVERLSPGPYLELFSRTNRPGWTSWGDQAGLFNQNTELFAAE